MVVGFVARTVPPPGSAWRAGSGGGCVGESQGDCLVPAPFSGDGVQPEGRPGCRACLLAAGGGGGGAWAFGRDVEDGPRGV